MNGEGRKRPAEEGGKRNIRLCPSCRWRGESAHTEKAKAGIRLKIRGKNKVGAELKERATI